MSQKDTSYLHIGSTLCLISYIFGFRKDNQIIEYTKDQWIDKKHHDLLQRDRNAQSIICYENQFKFIYLLR